MKLQDEQKEKCDSVQEDYERKKQDDLKEQEKWIRASQIMGKPDSESVLEISSESDHEKSLDGLEDANINEPYHQRHYYMDD